MSEIRPLHHSMLKRKTRPPRNMSRATIPDETREMIERESLAIFADMANAGCSLQQTLSAVFLSGMAAADEALR